MKKVLAFAVVGLVILVGTVFYQKTVSNRYVASFTPLPVDKNMGNAVQDRYIWIFESGKGIGRERIDKIITEVIGGLCNEGVLTVHNSNLACEPFNKFNRSVGELAGDSLGSVTRLSDLEDVLVDNAVAGNVLMYDGESWIATTLNIPRYTTEGELLQINGNILSLREGELKDANLCSYSLTEGLVCNIPIEKVGTDDQILTWDPATNQLEISNGNAVKIDELAQTLSLNSDILTISHTGSSVDLSPYRQSLSLVGNVLTISDSGSSVTFSNWDTDVTDDVTKFTDLLDTPSDYGIAGYLLQTDGSGNLTYVDPASLNIGYWQKNGTVLSPKNNESVVLQGGKLGIDTTTPQAKLHIYDTNLGGELLRVESRYIEGQLTGWSFRRPIMVTNNTATAVSDIQVKVVFDTLNLIAAGKLRSDCADIRFTDSDGTTHLSYWLESGCNTTATVVWVKIPYLGANESKIIYLYYGNPSATSASNGYTTFDFFDDFDGTSLDTTRWIAHQSNGSITLQNGTLRLYCATGGSCDWWGGGTQAGVFVESVQSFNYDSWFETKVSSVLRSSSSHTGIGEYGNLDNVSLFGPYGGTEIRLEVIEYDVGYQGKLIFSSTDTSMILSIAHIPAGGSRAYEVNYGQLSGNNANSLNDDHKLVLFGKNWGGTVDITFDWVRVRKYLNVEPTVTVGAEEGVISSVGPLQVNFIIKDGLVGIHTANPQYALQVGDAGDGTIAISNAWVTFSDRRFKENIVPIRDALITIARLQGVLFRWKQSGSNSAGFIAQDVEKVLPDIVFTDAQGYKSVDYVRIIPYLVEAVKELSERVDSGNTSGNSYFLFEDDHLLTNYAIHAPMLVAQEVNVTKMTASVIKASTIEVASGSFFVSYNGDTIIKGTLYVEEVESEKVSTEQIYIGSQSAGVITVEPNITTVNITANVTADDLVLVTVRGDNPLPVSVEVKDGEFTIHLPSHETSITLNYLIIRQK